MAFTPTNVNDWLFTIAGLDAANGNTQPVPAPFLGQYVNELNPVPPATTPVATPAEIQANLENFPFNPGTPPPTNIITDTFYRTTVADFVLREFQLAWGVVPTSGAAASQYDAWVARVIDNPANMTAGGMSAALVGTPQFQGIFGTGAFATAGTIALLCAHAGVPVGAGAMANVGLPMAEVLQNFAENSALVSNALAAPIANFQNLLLAGGAAPAGNLLTLSGSPGANLTLTTGVDTPTTGFRGTGATATQAGAVFLAPPGTNILGASNTLNAGDNLVATGAALGNTTLNYTAVASLTGNGPDAVGVTMTGVNAAIITNLAGVGNLAGFSGTITGLTTATLAAGSTFDVALGAPGSGLNTALATVNVNAAHDLTATMTAAALAAAPTGTVNVNGGVVGAGAALNVDTGVTGYGSLTVNSAGPGGTTTNGFTLDTNATNTATITATGAEFLTLTGTALDIHNLHTFTGNGATPDTGGLNVTFINDDGLGQVTATGGSGVNTFTFDETLAGAASFTSTSTVNGGTGGANTNTLDIQADTGAILLAGVGPNITNIATIEHTTGALGVTGPLTADLALMGSATTFDLAGTYLDAALVPQAIDVTDITALQTVEFSGSRGDLSLAHAAPAAGQVFDFTMSQNAPNGPGGTLDLDALTVALPALPPGSVQQVNLHSMGNAANNDITDVSGVAANITVDGATHLTFGSAAGAYMFNPDVAGGATINASAATGGVEAWLGNVGITNVTNAVQTFTGGSGTNVVHVLNLGGDTINFAAGATNTVEFNNVNADSGQELSNINHQYNEVFGFAAGNSVNINVANIGVALGAAGLTTTQDVPVAAGDPVTPINYATGTTPDGTTTPAGFNFVNITTPVATAPGETAQAAFNAVMGPNPPGFITTAGATNQTLGSFFDSTNGEAVYFVDTVATNPIEQFDAIAVVGLVHMTQTQYNTTAASAVHFV